LKSKNFCGKCRKRKEIGQFFIVCREKQGDGEKRLRNAKKKQNEAMFEYIFFVAMAKILSGKY
jgi:hypothetical protein